MLCSANQVTQYNKSSIFSVYKHDIITALGVIESNSKHKKNNYKGKHLPSVNVLFRNCTKLELYPQIFSTDPGTALLLQRGSNETEEMEIFVN